jgi:hypothetical protein
MGRVRTIVARNVPWKPVPQAIATKVLLARRGCGSALHLGARFDGEGKLLSHAWPVGGGAVVVGFGGRTQVIPLARFG